ncbi:MAG: hypothetical protein JO202_19405 [Ktedonobacteraceae bacterium]|nr:hypothetical protein [Ktedonobacteraceae bacterium]
MNQLHRTLAAVLLGCDRAYAQLAGHTVLVDDPGDDATAIYLDGARANHPDESWYDSFAQMETAIGAVLTGYVPGSALWQPAEADLHTVLAEWGRHPEPSGYQIGPGYVQFDDCSLCRTFGWLRCTGHDYDPDALDALEEELDHGERTNP